MFYRLNVLLVVQGMRYVNGYDDVEIIAGAGTMGMEILEQVLCRTASLELYCSLLRCTNHTQIFVSYKVIVSFCSNSNSTLDVMLDATRALERQWCWNCFV